MLPRTKRGGWGYNKVLNVDFEINWENPITRGLVFAVPLFGPSVWGTQRYIDLVGKKILVPSGTPSWGTDARYGQSVLFDSATSEYIEALYPVLTSVPMSMACRFKFDNSAGLNSLMGISDNTNEWWGLQHWPSNDGSVLARTRAVGGSGFAQTSTVATDTEWHHACGVFAANNDRRAYLDGGGKGTEATVSTPTGVDRTEIAAMGGEGTADHRIADVFIWNRVLNDSEVAYIANPHRAWEMYRPKIHALNAGMVAVAARTPRYGFTTFQIPGIV